MRFRNLRTQIVSLMLLLGVSASGQTAGDPVDVYTTKVKPLLAPNAMRVTHRRQWEAFGWTRERASERRRLGTCDRTRACVEYAIDPGRNPHPCQNQDASRADG